MLQHVDVGQRTLEAYRGIAPEQQLAELERCARELRGARVLHLNATPYGGGVSELLRSTVPLLNALGLVADWRIISGDSAFFEVTKALHNGLQGQPGGLSAAQRETYLANAQANAQRLEERYDFVFVHDPQPLALLALAGKHDARWVWRCHIDTAAPDADAWALVQEFLPGYDAAVFTLPEFRPPGIPVDRVEVFPPAIDPLSPKNLPLARETARQVLDWIGVDLSRPLITQVSRFDPWKDPLGVIAAYRQARERFPGLQLALVGSMALDDPEGWTVYREIVDASADDPLIHVFTNLTGVGNIEVNAFQSLSEVVVQKSTREGFGLVVSEALWKGTPVVGGRTGGIPLQMADETGGRLVDSVEECAQALVELLSDRAGAQELAAAGRARVREHFLLPRLLLNELTLMLDLARARPLSDGPPQAGAPRDPVCGMTVAALEPTLTSTYHERPYHFCSQACKTRFVHDPERYLPAIASASEPRRTLSQPSG